MKCFPITFILVVVAETLFGAVMSGIDHFTSGQEVEENLIMSKRRALAEHDHRTDSAYAGILSKLFAILNIFLTFYDLQIFTSLGTRLCVDKYLLYYIRYIKMKNTFYMSTYRLFTE